MHGLDPSFPPIPLVSPLSAIGRGLVVAAERPGARVTT